MFRHFWTVVGVLLKDQFRAKPTANETKQKRKRRAVSTGLVYILIVVGFSPLLALIGYTIYSLGALRLGMYAETVAFLILVCQGVVLLFSFQSILRNVFMCADGHRLLCLPLTSATIFAAKLFVAYLFETITSVVMAVALLVPFGIGAGFSLSYFLMLLPVTVLLPVLPMFIGILLCIPLSMLLNRLKNHNVLRLVFQVLFFLAAMALYMVFLNSMYKFDGSGNGDINALVVLLRSLLENISGVVKYVYPVYWMGVTMTSAVWSDVLLGFLGALVCAAVMFLLAVLCALPMYKRNLVGQNEGSSGARKKSVQFKQRGIVAELAVTDAKRMFRDKQFGLPALLGIVMLPIISVFMFVGFNAGSEGGGALNSFPIYQLIAPLALFAYMLLIGMSANPIVMYPISRENRAFYLLKTYPIGLSYIFKAKLLLGSLSILAGYLLTGILSGILFDIDWIYVVFMTVSMSLYAFAQMCIVTIFDLKNPKLNWTNFNQSLKNSRTVWQSMLVSLVVILVIAGIGVAFGFWYLYSGMDYIITVMWIAVIVLGVAFSAVSYKLLISMGKKLFARIEI